jgi:hypothetical protein
VKARVSSLDFRQRLISSAAAKGLRLADDWERQNLDPKALFQAYNPRTERYYGPLFVRNENEPLSQEE